MVQDHVVAQDRWLMRFGAIWLGQAASLIGSALAHFALVWWVTETTGSATALASAALVAMLPGIVLGPFAGALVDRWNRRLVMIVADGVVAAASAWLVLLLSQGRMQMWHVYVALVIRSLGGSFHWPAMRASTSLMVPREHLTRVAGANMAVGGIVDVAGPPLGALLMTLMPLHSIMAIDVGTALLAILPLLAVTVPQPERVGLALPAHPAGGLWADVRSGLAYVLSWQGLTALILLATVLNLLLGPALSLLPLLVTQHFGAGAPELAALQAAWGAGIIGGGVLLGAWGGFRKRVHTILIGVVGSGVGITILVSVPPEFLVVGLGAAVIAGLMNAMCNGAISAVMQERVDPAMQGRVLTVLRSLAQAMMPLGLLVVGPVADSVGVRMVILVGAAAQVLLGGAALSWGALQRLEEERPVDVAMTLSAEALEPAEG